jgi:hypothetical protein
LLAMLAAIRSGRGFVALTALALILEATHLAYIEYFAGLELCRPAFLWLLLSSESAGERWKKTLKHAAPYLAVLALFVVYRSSWAAIFGYDRFTPLATLVEVMRSPLSGIAGIAQSVLQDLVYILLSQWYAALDPAIIDLSRPSTFLILGSIVLFAALAYVVFTRAPSTQAEPEVDQPARRIAVAGFICVVVAMLPFWLTGFSIYQKNQLWSERLALAAMPGAAMLLVGGVYALADGNRQRFLILGTLVGLGVGMQAQIARNFQASWDKQEDFYWQLRWRAPALKPGTMIVSDQEILFYMGIYPTAFALNMLYPQATPPPEASYWFNAGFEHVNFDRFAAGQPDSFEKYGTTFTAVAHNVLAITFEPGNDQCLWVLGSQLANARALTPTASTWLEVSNASQIEASPPTVPPPKIFGPEPPHTWCYYYESAELASQSGDWPAVARLWMEAQSRGLRGSNAVELLPFISASARLGSWEEARNLTAEAQTLPDRSTSVLCDLWRDLGATAPPSSQRDRTTAGVEHDLGCQR